MFHFSFDSSLLKSLRAGLVKRKVQVKGHDGQLSFADRWVLPAMPEIVSVPKRASTPSLKQPTAQPIQPSGQMSLFGDSELPKFTPKAKAKPQKDGGTLSLFGDNDAPEIKPIEPKLEKPKHVSGLPIDPHNNTDSAVTVRMDKTNSLHVRKGKQVHISDRLSSDETGRLAADARHRGQWSHVSLQYDVSHAPDQAKEHAKFKKRAQQIADAANLDIAGDAEPVTIKGHTMETQHVIHLQVKKPVDSRDKIETDEAHHYEHGKRVRGANIDDKTLRKEENVEHERTSSRNRTETADHDSNQPGDNRSSDAAVSESLGNGVPADLGARGTGDSGTVDTRRDTAEPRESSAGSDRGRNRNPRRTGNATKRSHSPSNEKAPGAASDELAAANLFNIQWPTEETPAPPLDAPAPQTFDGDQSAEIRETGIGIDEPGAPFLPETHEQAVTAHKVRQVIARGLTQKERDNRDLVLTDADGIGKGSLGQKAKDNFAALDLLQALESENREPTEAEKKTLARYVGWGAFGQAFQDAFAEFADQEWDDIPDRVKQYRFSGSDKDHFKLYKQIKSRLSDEDFKSARGSILNAHYTAPAVVEAMYTALQHMGFSGGRVLEPSCGTGNFFGFMPPELAERSKRTGVELDRVTGRIARYLYPSSQIHIKGFEEAPIPDNSQDLVIGNVPFGDYGVVDHDYAKAGKKHLTSRIHNYFFAKSLDKARPGGIVALITSSGTMDSKGDSVRQHLADRAHFIGAIRLPNNAFDESAGTKVTTDIIFLQKRDAAFEALHPRDAQGRFIKKWTDTKLVSVPYADTIDNPGAYKREVPVSEYFAEHPEMMLGKLALGAGLYRSDSVGLLGDGRDINEALQNVIENHLPRDVFYKPDTIEEAKIAERESAKRANDTVKPGAFTVDNGKLYINHGGTLVEQEFDPTGRDKKKRERIIAQHGVLEALRGHMALELEGGFAEDHLAASRDNLNKTYDEFVKAYGHLHDRANVGAFSSDPDAGLLLALEHRNRETGAIDKADIFTKRTLSPNSTAESAESPTDALGIVLNEIGELDWERMSELLNREPEGIRDELAAAGLIYRNPIKEDDPVTGGWVMADAYLSGEVKKKLELARGVAEVDPSYAANVTALEAVQPAPLLPSQIEARLGAPWIPAEHINAFYEHLLGRGYTKDVFSFTKHNGWSAVSLDSYDSRRTNAAATSRWGTLDVGATKILETTLNLRDVTVTMPHPEDPDKRITDPKATIAARAKQQDIKNEWRRWLESDVDRSQKIADLYNSLFNTTAPREYDGSHLTFPGMAERFRVGFRQHAKNAVWRAIQSGNVLFDHVVGGGKTGCIAATAMELRRLQLAKKPMVVVRNPQLEQWEREFREIYPNAKLLVISEGMGNAVKRKELTNKIATGDWDAVIVAQSTFKEIPASPHLYASYIQEQMDDLRDQLNEEKARVLSTGSEKKREKAQKQIENAIKKLEYKLETLKEDIAEHQDNSTCFDQLGIDALLVDEAHDYKNLAFTTRMGRVSGLSNASSEKAMDMFVKSQDMLRKNGGRGLIFATGTPVSNTLSEMWTMKRYLMLPKLKELGFERFDSWAANFGDTVTSIEKAPEGGFRQRTRFARFVNVPEMIGLYRQVADVKTRDDLKHILPVPTLHTGAPIVNTAPANDELKAYMETLQERARKLQEGTVDPSVDNFLKITSDGRKAALDLRLVKPDAADNPNSKVAMCANNAAKLHHSSRDRKATQLIFLDLGTPTGAKDGAAKKGKSDEENSPLEDGEESGLRDSVYGDMKRKLIAQGVPEAQIAFAHDFDTPAKRAQMSARMDSGDLSVLIGSTMKMGVGLNVQKRLYAVHHLDCPWKPGELEQRDGRILRQGNLHHESQWNIPIQIHRYGTQNSFDEYMWQAVAKKAAFIAQTRRGDCARTCEDMDETVMTASSMQAALSDNPLIGEKAEVDAEAYRLGQLRRAHMDERFNINRAIATLPTKMEALLKHAKDHATAAAHYMANRKEKFSFSLNGQTFADKDAAGDALATVHERIEHKIAQSPTGVKIGSYNGFDLVARYASSEHECFDNRTHMLAYHLQTPNGEGRHSLHVGASGLGTITKIDNGLKGLSGEATASRTRANEVEKQLHEYKSLVGKPFEHEAEYERLTKRQREIEEELGKGGDEQAATAEGEVKETLQKSFAGAFRDKTFERLAKAIDGFRLISQNPHR